MKKEMTETRELILNALGELSRLAPLQRFGQILYNYLLVHCRDNDPFFKSDEEVLEILEAYVKNFKEQKHEE